MNIIFADLKRILILFFISLIILLFDHVQLLNIPKSLLQNLTIPIQYGLYTSGKAVSKQFEFIYLTRRAAQENSALKEQLANLLTENAILRRQLSETQKQIEQYQALSSQTFHLMPSRVIGFSRYLTLDKGSDDGVKKDAIVVFKDNYIGKVKQVNPKTSLVMLAQDPDSKIAVFSRNKDGRARGILSGQFGSELLMDKILHQEPVEVGDLVYSEGTEGQLPRGLIVGRVSEVLDKQNEVFKQAKVDTIFEISDLEVVFIILNI